MIRKSTIEKFDTLNIVSMYVDYQFPRYVKIIKLVKIV